MIWWFMQLFFFSCRVLERFMTGCAMATLGPFWCLILRAKYEMAIYSVEDKRAERYRETVDEYYAFKNEFPESKYMKEADRIFKDSEKILNEDKQS